MKSFIIICFFCSFFMELHAQDDIFINSAAQNFKIFQLRDKNGVFISSFEAGKIVLSDGSNFRFRSLKQEQDSVFFVDNDNQIKTCSVQDVLQLYKTQHLAPEGLLLGAGFGFLGSVVVVKVTNVCLNIFWNIFTLNFDGPTDYSKDLLPIKVLGTVCGAVLGAGIGSLMNYNKLVYERGSFLSFNPGILNLPDNQLGMSLTCRINLEKLF